MKTVTKSAAETRKIARLLAKEIKPHARGAVAIALEGDLGAGKTTFTQGFARALGVKESVLSPTFVLMKIYSLEKSQFRHFVHIDCYRIKNPKDLIHLGVKDILKDKDAIVLIEWANLVKKIIPRDAIWLKFMHGNVRDERYIVTSSHR